MALRAPTESPFTLDPDTGVINSVPWLSFYNRGLSAAVSQSSQAQTITDTSANIVNYTPSAYTVGTLYVQTDRSVVYQNTGTAWVYVTGVYSAPLASIPTLGANDAGFRFGVTDYSHELVWNGTAWGWAAGDPESGYFVDSAIPKTGPGWHPCDGSTNVHYLQADGTLGTLPVLPNTLATPAYRKLGASYSAVITAASLPLLTMAPYTPQGTVSRPTLVMDSYRPAGTNSAPALVMNSFTPAGTNSAPTFGGIAATITTTNFISAAGVTPALVTFGGSTSTYTPAGVVSAPTFTGTPAVLTGTVAAPIFTGTPAVLTGTISIPTFTGTVATLTGTISLPADPVAHFQAMQYFRQ